jgi:NTP pyrophosphatase (non-canonical NTP hydrolase)
MSKFSMTELTQFVIEWGKDRNLIERKNADKQMIKVVEEVGELAASLLKNDERNIVDSIGDSFVTLIILSAQLGLDPTQCLNEAYSEIANRKGKTVDGTFIKE